MLCLDHTHPPLTTLHQIKLSLSTNPSNASLFQRLAWEYDQKREPFTLLTFTFRPFWREVKAIHFVRFMTLGPQPVMTAQIEEMHSLPGPHGWHGWICNRSNGINASIMARFLQEPNSVGGDRFVYDYIPKSRSPLPPKDGFDGWGLYMEEGVSWVGILLCVWYLYNLFLIVYFLAVLEWAR